MTYKPTEADKMEEYLRQKRWFEDWFKSKMESLKIIYPEQWKKDHEHKAAGK